MICTVGAEKGGVGKTRLAVNLAALAASDGVDVVLLDTDSQGSAAGWSRIRKEEGIEPTIPLFALPQKPAHELENLSKRYTLIVVDIGAQNYRTMTECALLSDLVIVPCGPDQQELESTFNVFDELKRLGPKHEFGRIPAYVVLTRMTTHPRSKETEATREMLMAEGISVFSASLAYRTAWRNVGRSGRALHELVGDDKDPKAAAEMRAVYDELVRRINEQEGA